MMRQFLDIGKALGVATLGAFVFMLVGFPAAALTGSAVAVTIAGLVGMRFALPVWMRNAAFVVLGINIGTGVTPEMLATAATWPLSIAILGLSLVIGLALTQAGLVRWMGFSRRDATLAAAPGHLSYVLSLSLERGGDTARIAVVQSIRVLFLTLCVPLLVTAMFGVGVVALLPAQGMSLWALLGLAAGALTLGWVFQRISVPAAFLLAGMAVSALGHMFELTPGRLDPVSEFAAFIILGTLIGSRFAGQSVSVLRGGLVAGIWVTTINVVVTLLAMGVALVTLGLPPALLIVGFAPGGVEAMAAMAVTLGLDPAFVAAHHVMRLVILTVLIPLWLRR
jgi:membrane AbrB-like protein